MNSKESKLFIKARVNVLGFIYSIGKKASNSELFISYSENRKSTLYAFIYLKPIF